MANGNTPGPSVGGGRPGAHSSPGREQRETSPNRTNLQQDATFPVRIASIQKNAEEELRVSINEFRGHVLVDVRVFVAFTTAGTPMATKKGVSIRVEQLPDLVGALKDTEAAARAMGLL